MTAKAHTSEQTPATQERTCLRCGSPTRCKGRCCTSCQAFFKERYATRVVTVYMDKVDWDHEVGQALGGNKVYPSLRNIKETKKCLDECGIVQVEMRLKRVIQHSNFFGKRKRKR